MLEKVLQTVKVRNLNGEITVGEKVIMVSVNDENVNCSVNLSDDSAINVGMPMIAQERSYASISVNIETSKVSISQQNVETVTSYEAIINEIVVALKSIITEITNL